MVKKDETTPPAVLPAPATLVHISLRHVHGHPPTHVILSPERLTDIIEEEPPPPRVSPPHIHTHAPHLSIIRHSSGGVVMMIPSCNI